MQRSWRLTIARSAHRPSVPTDWAWLAGRIILSASTGRSSPWEQKPRARRVHDSHVMQLAAQCLLVTEVYGVRPPYGLLVLANGVQQRVPFTRALEKRVLETMARMRVVLEAGTQPGRRWMGSRCRACGFFETCWE